MNRRKGLTFAIGVILLISLTLTFELMKPRTRVLYQVEGLELDFHPEYHVVNFTLLESEKNPVFIIDIDLNRNQDPTDYYLRWRVYPYTMDEFESVFNITDSGTYGTVAWGWTYGSTPTLDVNLEAIPGPFVFVFWVDPEGTISGWTADVILSLQSTLI